MGRGKAFHHKKKGHEPQLPKGAVIEKDIDEHKFDLPDVVTVETYKNSLRKG
ncbi:hypothetical protein [Ectobacillus polymachus]|uniref:hypothetical protein n=1 Tax=Ectobacillus polymachus TaxID=1508806 RepID=UPI003A8AA025